jgi:hypothetical protein
LVIDEAGKQRASIHVDHTAQGLVKLNTFLEGITGSDKKDQMACIVETNQGLLITFLLEAGWHVYPVNPRTVDRRRLMPICLPRPDEQTLPICVGSFPIAPL